MKLFKSYLPFLFLLAPILVFFSPVFFQNKIPLPADTIPGLYHPMRDAISDEYPNGPPYKNYLITDSVRQQYPWRKFSINQLKQGQIPWWNPYNFSGTPHLANFQSATFYPLNLIFWLTDFNSGWTALVISQQILGALFLYLFLKNKKLHPLAAIFGALTWIFSGFFIAWLEWNTTVHVAIWTPLILLSIDKIFATQPIKHQLPWLIILLLSLSAQALAGYPQPWIYLSILQGSYFLVNLKSTQKLNPFFKTTLIYTLFIIITSIQLLPTLQFSQLSNRDLDQGGLEYNLTRVDWFLPYQNLIQVIVPDYFGNPATLNYYGVFNYTEFVSFIGIIPALFVFASFTSKRKSKLFYFFSAFLILSLLLATKNPISTLQFKLKLPFLGSSQPSRWIVIIDLCLSILAALGLHRFLNKKAKLTKPIIILSLVLITTWVITLNPKLLNLKIDQIDRQTSQRNLILPTLELIFATIIYSKYRILSIKSIDNRLKKIKNKHITLILKQSIYISSIFLILASVTIGVRFAKKFTPFSNKQFIYPKTAILSYIKENQQQYRYMTKDRRILAPNFNLEYGLYTIEGYDPLYLKDYGQLIYAAETPNWPQSPKAFNRIITSDSIESPLIDLLGVKFILSLTTLDLPKLELILEEGDTKLYQNNNVLPRAFTTDQTDVLQLSLDNTSPATITTYTPNQVKITYSSPEETNLILTDAYYPNWQATLDGQPIEVSNYHGLRATIVPEGNHEIIYTYKYSHP